MRQSLENEYVCSNATHNFRHCGMFSTLWVGWRGGGLVGVLATSVFLRF